MHMYLPNLVIAEETKVSSWNYQLKMVAHAFISGVNDLQNLRQLRLVPQ